MKSIWVYYKGDIDVKRDNSIREAMGEKQWYGSGTDLKTFVRDHSFYAPDLNVAEARASSLKGQGLIDSYRVS